MAERPTFASVTDVPCTCGYLERSADASYSPIVFDALTSEFQFVWQKGSKLVIYHCPFCGGTAPPSKRSLLFAIIPPEEQSRLARLLAPVRTVRSALKRLGTPNRDSPSGTWTGIAEADGKPPKVQQHRTLVYEGLSKVADVMITERADGKISWQLIGKYVGPPQA